jgi:hypothetical protein
MRGGLYVNNILPCPRICCSHFWGVHPDALQGSPGPGHLNRTTGASVALPSLESAKAPSQRLYRPSVASEVVTRGDEPFAYRAREPRRSEANFLISHNRT